VTGIASLVWRAPLPPRRLQAMDFPTMMALEPHGPDTFVGVGPRYPWGGLYGGQIVAQGLRAAAATVEPAFRVHSLHAYFIRPGSDVEPIRFEVDRLRNGRSFATRAVVARQSAGAILTMATSFQLDEAAPDLQTAEPPAAPAPDSLPATSWNPMFDRRRLRGLGRGRAAGWLKTLGPIGEDPIVHACALAYLSDDLPTEAVVLLQPEARSSTEKDWMTASLDHAIWFHRPAPADDWQLHDLRCHGLLSSRGVAVGHVFSGDTHVATVAQEVLVRRRRQPG
jgi:acyl-CoA thioesterase II